MSNAGGVIPNFLLRQNPSFVNMSSLDNLVILVTIIKMYVIFRKIVYLVHFLQNTTLSMSSARIILY